MNELQEAHRPHVEGHVILSPIHTSSGSTASLFVDSEPTKLFFTYPLKLLVPEKASSNSCRWVYPLTYGGGLVGGDSVHLTVETEDRVGAVLTTQASTKVYHCEKGVVTKQTFVYKVHPNSLLCILPDPIVCYKDANYLQKQEVHMTAASNLVLLDWLTAGRMARGECWQFTSYKSLNRIFMDDRLIFCDNVHLADTPHLTVKAAMGQYLVSGILVIIGPQLLNLAQKILDNIGKQKQHHTFTMANETVVSVSPLNDKSIGSKSLIGCVVRFMAHTTSKAHERLDGILKDLYEIIGGDPLDSKY